MDLQIFIFDKRSAKKFGVHFNGQIEDADSLEPIGYLDFMTKANIMRKVPQEVANIFATYPDDLFFSGIKDTATKKFHADSYAILLADEGSPFRIHVCLNGMDTGDVWLQQLDSKTKRYMATGRVEPLLNSIDEAA